MEDDHLFTHLYIELKGTNTQKLDWRWGHVVYNRFHLPKKIRSHEEETYNDFIKKHVSADQKVDIFIHGMWGNTPVLWHDQHRKLYPYIKDFYEYDEHRVFLSLIWDCSLDYFNNVYIAKVKGKKFSSVFTLLKTMDQNEINVLSHSMGNKISEFMYRFVQEENLRIHTWITIAADLNYKIFDEGQPLYDVQTICDKVYLFYHKNDHTLRISELMNKEKRIGRHGTPVEYAHIQQIDASKLSSTSLNSISNQHRYFYNNVDILKRLIYILSDEKYLPELKS